MIIKSVQQIALLLSLCLFGQYTQAWNYYGHLKYNFNYTDIPASNLAYPLSGDQQALNSLNLRFASENIWQNIAAEIHYEITDLSSNNPDLPQAVSYDYFRLMDLSSTIVDEADHQLVHRLDRFNVSYNAEQLVFRAGRQAVSWGNGFVFHPMDIFNPFDPVAIDKDYKTGDDMLYGQWLLDDGNDVQLIILPRRNLSADIDSNQGSLAVKYHGLSKYGDIDLLVAQHFDHSLLALGYARNVLEAIWRFDITVTEIASNKNKYSFITNLDYSWVWFDSNYYGFIEYFKNGFGEEDFTLTPDAELSSRLARGELFTTAEDYLALGLNIELHPLVNLLPTVILNLNDRSRLMPVTLSYNWRDNLSLKASIILSAGDSASEYGGAASPADQFNLIISYYY